MRVIDRESTASTSFRHVFRMLVLVCVLALSVSLVGCTGGSRSTDRGASSTSSTAASESPPPAVPKSFAVIGDFGSHGENEAKVAELVTSWRPDFVIALGDNFMNEKPVQGTTAYDSSVGKYYGAWLKDVTVNGSPSSGEASVNAFFPVLGNHDYSDALPAPDTYVTYFDLPGAGFTNSSGNERYYDFVEGPVHFFMLDSNPEEPDGTQADSKQGHWLQQALAASRSRWNVVCDHHAPFSSDNTHGPTDYMQWPFAQWGADVVMSGHAHVYERLERDGVTYFVNGTGGTGLYGFATPVEGSRFRFDSDWGAQKVTADDSKLVFEYYSVQGKLIDRYEVTAK